jgi:subtilase family serine protease
MTSHESTRRWSWRGVVVGVAIAALAGGAGTAYASPAPAGRVTLPSPLAGPVTGDVVPTDPDTHLQFRVFLGGRDATGRVRTAQAVSDPANPAYAHYLTPVEYRQRYGATGAQISAVRAWLTGQGMTVTGGTTHYLAVDATVGQAATAFGTTFQTYRQGDKFPSYEVAPVGDVSVPASFGTAIASVDGLTAYVQGSQARTAVRRPSAVGTARAAAFPCSHYWGEHRVSLPAASGHTSAPTDVCGYTPQQMQSAYGVAGSPYTGKGATVAIVLDARVPTMLDDANRFFAAHGLPGFRPGQYTEDLPPGFDCSEWPDGDNPEEALDVETVHIIAPDAKVVFVSAGCNYDYWDFLDAHTRVVDSHLADVVSDSWPGLEDGTSPALIAAWELVLQQGAIEGIGMNFASGDYGDGSSGTDQPANVPYPTSDAWATGGGGTSLAIGADGKRQAEWGWGDTVTPLSSLGSGPAPAGTFDMGSGGGVSRKVAQPAYQRDVTGASGGRVVPDVSADAGTFWLIGYTAPSEVAPVEPGPSNGGPDPGPPVYAERPAGGGTSGSSPLLAALFADAKQAGGHALGFANPALYRLAGTRALHDIRPVDPAHPPVSVGTKYCQGDAAQEPCLTTHGIDFGLRVTPGFDDVTGLGTPTNSFVTAFG